jgi:thiol-disulfide isomerase/thioredoxin
MPIPIRRTFAVLILGMILLGCDGKRQRTTAPAAPAKPTLAPEISGPDIDGKEMALSDFRGKVVVLSFWGKFCPPCRDLFPHERSLVTKYKNRPFVLVGVNGDQDKADPNKLQEDGTVTWRSWWLNENRRFGQKVSVDYQLEYFPTVCLINAKGDIVKRYVGKPPAEFDDLVEKLVKETEAAAKDS